MTDYMLASPEELARVQLQARVWEPDAVILLDRLDLAQGGRAIDLGCGAMGVLGPLARRLGPQGQVIGVDVDEKMLGAAQMYVQAEQLPNVELMKRDVLNLGMAEAMFDVVHARLMCPHLTDPAAFLQSMVRLAKPGGYVVTQEMDQRSWSFYPACPGWDRLMQIAEAVFALRSDLNFGRRTYNLLQQTELEEVKVRASVVALQHSHPYMRMVVTAINALRPHILQANISTETEIDELLAAVDQCINNPETVHLTFTMVQVWGRKPAQA